MTTPHLEAQPGAIAETVLLPGDPLRARHIARAFLSGSHEINARRNMLGYTGSYQGARVSVLGSGMGIPSCAIYATELARHYGVRRIVRIGTCGAIGEVALGDVLLAHGASTDSNYNRLHFGGHDLSACADHELLCAVAGEARRRGEPARVAHVFSTDCFYDGDAAILAYLARHRITGIDMETAGLYGLAMREGVQALSVLTVTDHLERGEHADADARERGVERAVALVLDALVRGSSPGEATAPALASIGPGAAVRRSAGTANR